MRIVFILNKYNFLLQWMMHFLSETMYFSIIQFTSTKIYKENTPKVK